MDGSSLEIENEFLYGGTTINTRILRILATRWQRRNVESEPRTIRYQRALAFHGRNLTLIGFLDFFNVQIMPANDNDDVRQGRSANAV